jgi:hypothetical protein
MIAIKGQQKEEETRKVGANKKKQDKNKVI